MTDPIMDELQRRFKPLLQKLEYLHDRWQDEREYEDWNDYVEAMRNLTPPDPSSLETASSCTPQTAASPRRRIGEPAR